MSEGSSATVTVLTAVYNDWPCLPELLAQIDSELGRLEKTGAVVIVDDGSTDTTGKELIANLSFAAIDQIRVVDLLRNLGNQRAIAVGIAYLAANGCGDHLIVMDADHEDNPAYCGTLIAASEKARGAQIVFADRTRRSESLSFRLGYFLFQGIFKLLTGHRISSGNFSAIPKTLLRRVASIGELWSHYPAAIMRAKIPYMLIPSQRAKRFAGKSSMNVVGLIIHALSGLTVHAETIGARVLLAAGVLALAILGALGLIVGLKLFSDIPIVGWTSQIAVLLLLMLLMMIGASFIMIFIIVSIRMQSPLVPLREYEHFIDRIDTYSTSNT